MRVLVVQLQCVVVSVVTGMSEVGVLSATESSQPCASHCCVRNTNPVGVHCVVGCGPLKRCNKGLWQQTARQQQSPAEPFDGCKLC